MDQHVISAWYLRTFARSVGRRRMLHVYDKSTDTFGTVSVDDFLAETDVHSADIERALNALEGPASGATRRLVKRVRRLPPGMYTVVGTDEETVLDGPSHFVGGQLDGTELVVTRHQLTAPTDRDVAAIAAYAGLMYWRAPKVRDGIRLMREAYDRAAQAVLDEMMPGMRAGSIEEIDAVRARMIRNATGVGARLATVNWWILRARDDEPFVLGDNPVGTTISLGYDDSWRAILSDQTFVVAMPLGPTTALVAAPHAILPFTGFSDPTDAASAVNRLIWLAADRYVVGRDREDLEGAASALGSARTSTIPIDLDLERVARNATGDSIRIAAQVLWRQIFGRWIDWRDCCLRVGYMPWAAEDRDEILGPPHRGR